MHDAGTSVDARSWSGGAYRTRKEDVATVTPRVIPNHEHIRTQDREPLVVTEKVGVRRTTAVRDLNVGLEPLRWIGRARVPNFILTVAQIGPRDVDAMAGVDGNPGLKLARRGRVVIDAERLGPGISPIFGVQQPDVIVPLTTGHLASPSDGDGFPRRVGSRADNRMLPRTALEAKRAHIRDQVACFVPFGAAIRTAQIAQLIAVRVQVVRHVHQAG